MTDLYKVAYDDFTETPWREPLKNAPTKDSSISIGSVTSPAESAHYSSYPYEGQMPLYSARDGYNIAAYTYAAGGRNLYGSATYGVANDWHQDQRRGAPMSVDPIEDTKQEVARLTAYRKLRDAHADMTPVPKKVYTDPKWTPHRILTNPVWGALNKEMEINSQTWKQTDFFRV